MMYQMLNQMRFQSALGQNVLSNLLCGIVTSYNPIDSTVQVSIQPEDEENPNSNQSGWLPLSTGFIGEVGAPNIGDQVIIGFQEGNVNAGIILGRLYSQVDKPPPVPSGEWWIIHQNGSKIQIKNNGEINIVGSSVINVNAPTVNINSSSEVNIISPSVNIGNNGILKSLVNDSMVDFFNTHTHGDSDVPNQMMGSGQLSSIIKAE